MSLSQTSLTAVLVVLSAVPGTCLAEDTVTIGGVTVSADSALARKEHPRLLFRRADLPRLRARLEHPRIAAELKHAKQLAAENKAGAILLGVLYYLTEEPKYIEAAKAKLEPTWVQTYPLAADLVMGAMTPAEQRAEVDHIVEIVKKERWRPHVVLDLAAWGHGHDDFLDADLKTHLHSDMIEGIEYNNLWSQGRGGSSMSHGYYGEHFYSEWFTMAVACSNATDQDWVSRCDFAAHTPEYYIYHYRPWAWPPQVVHIGVNAMCAHWQSITPAKFQGDNLAVLAAASFHDGLGQWWTDEVISKISMGWGTSALGQGGVWGKLLWYDPDLPRVEPKMLPPARLFPENGHVVMRSDWTEDATYADERSLRHRKEHDRENSIGLGGWRIELSSRDNPVSTNFLVVLQAADQVTESMVPVESIERDEQIGAKVTVGTTDYEVTFTTDGPSGGHIRVAQAGKVTLDRPLPAAVEDNYQKWSEDPRFDEWMTRPEYRKFIRGQ